MRLCDWCDTELEPEDGYLCEGCRRENKESEDR
jgi:hypothetical protein